MIAFDQLEICPLPALKARFSSMSVPLQKFSKNVAELDARIIEIRDTAAKDVLLQDLQIEFQNRYPNTVAQIIQYGESVLDQRIQRLRKQFAATGSNAITPPVGFYQVYYPNYDGDFDGFIGLYGSPRIVYFTDPPVDGVNGTYANQVDKGAFLVDSVHNLVYQNRGTRPSPTWAVWDTSMFADYIVNPSALYLWAGSLTVQCSLEDSTMRDEISPDRYDSLEKMLNRVYKIVAMDRARALQLIRVDTSLNGTITEFDRSAFTDDSFFEA